MITIQNDKLRMQISEVGAEIHSLFNKTSATEYIFDGNPAFWPRHTPLLFPVTGPLKGGTIRAKGKEYSIPVNGFARDLPFALLAQTNNSATFILEESPKTMEMYPFGFSLIVRHVLLENGYTSSATIVAKQEMWFTFGWHPAFSLAMNGKDADLSTYSITFENAEHVDRLCPVDGVFTTEKDFLSNEKVLKLSRQETDKGPIVLRGLTSKSVTLTSTKGPHTVTIERSDLPTLVIWTKEKVEGPYVCVEPMYSFNDANRDSNVETMEGMIHLAKGEERTYTNTFTVF